MITSRHDCVDTAGDSLYQSIGPLSQAASVVRPTLPVHDGLVHHVLPVLAPGQTWARVPVLLVPGMTSDHMTRLSLPLWTSHSPDTGGAAAVHDVLHQAVTRGTILRQQLLQTRDTCAVWTRGEAVTGGPVIGPEPTQTGGDH